LERYAIVILENNEIFKLFNVDQRSRSVGEWWKGVNLDIDQKFIWDQRNWKPLNIIYIRENTLDDEINDKVSKKDKKELIKYNYILINATSDKIAFAQPFQIENLIQKLEDQASKNYSKGYNKGYDTGKKDGYSSGYNTGYRMGYEAISNESYERGFKEGYEKCEDDNYVYHP
jgi:flagellar biosynthesis/type III secretory pathway protein FliH